MVYEWKDKTVLVTGGASGIGAELVRKLVEKKVKYIAFLDLLKTQALALKEELNREHGKQIVHFYKCDVSDEDQIAGIFDSVVKECEYIDVVVNNAGICNDNENMVRKEIDINFAGLVSISLKALALMRKDEGGRGGTIINVASIAALQDSPHVPVYAGTKSAVLQFSRSLGMDVYFKRTDVRVITLCFGPTYTTIFDRGFGTFDKVLTSQIAKILGSGPIQTAEAAAEGLSEAFEKGESGSTWVVNDSTAKDVSEIVHKGYELLSTAI